METPDYWRAHYVTGTNADEIAEALRREPFTSAGVQLELVHFFCGREAPNILVSQGSGGHGYVFAELGYHLNRAGYNVFIMPKHGGRTISQLLTRHLDALEHIHRHFRSTTAIYGEGLGGYVAFYLALARAPMISLVCQNAPAILTEPAYHRALLTDSGPWRRATRRRQVMLPAAARLVRWVPKLKVPLSSYLPWRDLVDTRQGSYEVEQRLVISGYLQDPDFDRWYPLEAVMSLVTTPPPGRLEELATPTMFVVASEGPTPSYIADLYDRLPDIPRRLVRVDGSVYWMLSHPHEAVALVSGWIAATS